ncbi:helix-turn-helix domain-containing protein [Thaumasiovibrio sp. DFM-14]|uniref:AraC family transcriptional regulator n=1 Tax=Thaumasiovibrio sp. DFM-14 TaxID=3384792 RepID=UPI0039A1A010
MTKCELSTLTSQYVHNGWGQLLHQAAQVYGLKQHHDIFERAENKTTSPHLDISMMRQVNHQLIQDSKDPLFAIKASRWVSALTFGSYSLTLWTAPNLHHLLKDACNFNLVLGSPTRIAYQQKNSGDVELRFISNEALSRHYPERQAGLCLYVATFIQIIQKTSINGISNLEVELANTPYSQQVQSQFAAEMECDVTLGAAFHTLRIKSEHLEQKLATSDSEIYPCSRALLRKQAAKIKTEDTPLQIYNVLDQFPTLADISSERIAAEMLISVRTLNRRLAEVGLNYRSVVENYKLEKATQLLSQPDSNITEIAFQLGFSDLSAFSRAFKRWTGTSPSHFNLGYNLSAHEWPHQATLAYSA